MSCAFKVQNEKGYGSVEKMYIHFYTVTTGTDTLDIFWYCNDTENIALFSDLKYYFNKMKTYKQYTTCTGDIFVVKNLHKFKELLILVGAEDANTTTWSLQDNIVLPVNMCKVKKISKFYDIFDICFEDYEIINSFSTEPDLSKNRIEINEYITNFDTNNSLILVNFNGNKYPMPYYKFNKLLYLPIKSKVGDTTLNNWFNSVITKDEYYTVYNTIHKLIDYNEKEVDTSIDDNEKDDTTVTEAESPKISHSEWIKKFSELYLEESIGSDLLLSDMYQMYVTASGWSQTPTVSMSSFIKYFRAMNKYTIKRRAKGMMVIGISCLVNQQQDFSQQTKKGCNGGRHLLHYQSENSIQYIITTYKDLIEQIGHKYTREAFILLHRTELTLDYQTIIQFISIPQISTHLKLFAEYIDFVLNSVSNSKNSTNDDVKKESLKFLNEFRTLATNCIIYFPFALKYKSNPIKTLSSVEAFNEHFGMFNTSKNYHCFEPEKGLPQDYNNMKGTPLDILQ